MFSHTHAHFQNPCVFQPGYSQFPTKTALVCEKDSIMSSAHLLVINSDFLHFQRRIQEDPGFAYHRTHITVKVDALYTLNFRWAMICIKVRQEWSGLNQKLLGNSLFFPPEVCNSSFSSRTITGLNHFSLLSYNSLNKPFQGFAVNLDLLHIKH